MESLTMQALVDLRDRAEAAEAKVARVEAEVRADERKRLAAAIEANWETIAEFANTKGNAVQLVAHLLRHHSTEPRLATAADAIHDGSDQ